MENHRNWLKIFILAALFITMLTKEGSCQEQPAYCRAFITINEATTEEKQVETVTSILESISPEISEVLMFEISDNSTFMPNDSMSTPQIAYERLAKHFGVKPTPTGYNNYIEAVNEVSLAQAEACRNTSFVPTPDLVSQLAEEFETMFLAEEKDPSRIRLVFGKLLCLKTRSDSQRKKRQAEECKAECSINLETEQLSKAESICEFFQCLILKYEIKKIVENIFGLPVSEVESERIPSCLAIALDYSGSMAEELDAAKQVVREFLVNVATFNEELCYIFVAFSRFQPPRPDVDEPQIVYITKDDEESRDTLQDFNDYITNLQLEGGGGGPEHSLDGMLAALRATRKDGTKLMIPGSQLIVLTDEPTENTELNATIIEEANDQNVCIHFFLSDSHGALQEESFHLITEQVTGSTLQEFTSLNLAEFVSTYTDKGCANNPSKRSAVATVSGITKRQAGLNEECKDLHVSSFTYLLTLSIQTEYSTTVTITRSNGTTTLISIAYHLGTLAEVNPVEGVWKICTNARGRPTNLEVLADQKIVFDTSILFVNEGADNPSSTPPPLCTSSRIALLSSQSSKISFASLNLFNEDGSLSRRIILRKCDGFFVSDAITFGKTETLTVQLAGHDAHGVAFVQDTSHEVVFDENRSVNYALSAATGNNVLRIGSNDTLSFSFYLYNPEQYSTRFSFASSSVTGFQKNVTPTSVVVGPRERAEITFTLQVDQQNTENLSPGSSYRFALFGSNGCKSVSASKAVVFSG